MASILIVDDDEAAVDMMAGHLRQAGHAVTTAHDGLAALDQLDSDRAIDILVTDLNLPAGSPHGLALAAMGVARRPDLRRLVITGYPELMARYREVGNVLLKPFRMETLERAIRACLAGPPARKAE